jgi:hypothetical protein
LRTRTLAKSFNFTIACSHKQGIYIYRPVPAHGTNNPAHSARTRRDWPNTSHGTAQGARIRSCYNSTHINL